MGPLYYFFFLFQIHSLSSTACFCTKTNEFLCDGCKCLDESKLCDNIPHCADGKDEDCKKCKSGYNEEPVINRATPLPDTVVTHNLYGSHPPNKDTEYFVRFAEPTDVVKAIAQTFQTNPYDLKIIFFTTEGVITVRYVIYICDL